MRLHRTQARSPSIRLTNRRDLAIYGMAGAPDEVVVELPSANFVVVKLALGLLRKNIRIRFTDDKTLKN